MRATTLPVVKGAILQVEEIDGDFKTRAEVRNISIGADGHPRLNLLFLDCPHPGAAPAGGGRRREAGEAERVQGQPEAERRRQRRVPLKLPVRVQGRDADGAGWEEMSTCEDASLGGVALLVSHPVRPGQVLHLSVPLPQRFRQYDINDSSYRTYALVRHARPWASALRVGVLFLGRHPPRGAEALPAELFLMPGERRGAAGAPRADVCGCGFRPSTRRAASRGRRTRRSSTWGRGWPSCGRRACPSPGGRSWWSRRETATSAPAPR